MAAAGNQQYERDAVNIQTGERNRICQREQEATQFHVEVLQRLHTLEQAGEKQIGKQWRKTWIE